MKIYIRQRPKIIPPHWRKITSFWNDSTSTYSKEILLVLDACGIDRRHCVFAGKRLIYVPPMLEKKAEKEIREFLEEKNSKVIKPLPFVFPHSWNGVFLLASFLIIFYGLFTGIWPLKKWFPPQKSLLEIGNLNYIDIKLYGQWFRLATGLTLQADISHLMTNLFFGCFFIYMLARRVGYGMAFLMSMIGGIIGNLCAILIRPAGIGSIGYSTSVFAIIGLLCNMDRHNWKQLFLTIAAAVALLAMLGTEGENTDYPSHIGGLLAGFILSFINIYLPPVTQKAQIFAAIAACLLPVGAWIWAICKFG